MAQVPLADSDFFLYKSAMPYFGEKDTNGTMVVPSLNYIKNGSGLFVPVSAADPMPTTLQGRNVTVSVETNATTDEGTSAFDVAFIDTLKNDGAANIVFNFDAATTEAGARTVKPGEAIADLPKTCTTLHYKAASGVQPFRAWGLK